MACEGVKKTLNRSLGIIEVMGMVTAMSCVDAMVKSAFVEVKKIERVTSGMIAILIHGDLASVQFALEIGAEEAWKHGEVVAVKAIPRPADGLDSFISPQEKGVGI